MQFSDLYSGSANLQTQATSEPASSSRDTTPAGQAPAPTSGMGQHAVTISALGIILALVLLRVVYEVSE